MREYQSLSHTKWNCKYHIVFIPKRRKKVIFGRLRKHLGQLFHELAQQKGCEIVEGHLMSDHVHMCISIPPKYAISNVVGFIKGRSAVSIARQFMGKTINFTGENFWARGYFVSTRSYALTTGRNSGFKCVIFGIKVPINEAHTSLNKFRCKL